MHSFVTPADYNTSDYNNNIINDIKKYIDFLDILKIAMALSLENAREVCTPFKFFGASTANCRLRTGLPPLEKKSLKRVENVEISESNAEFEVTLLPFF